MKKFTQPFHLVSNSPWPLFSSLGIMFLLLGTVKYIYLTKMNLLMVSILLMIFILFQWWRDVSRESVYQGYQGKKMIFMFQLGIMIFILSELMFFLSFFWSYFHLYLSPGIDVGETWSMKNIIKFDFINLPLLNTLLLLSSGGMVTWCHYNLIDNKRFMATISLILTMILGLIFVFFQYMEYSQAFYSMNDGSYGSIFFLATGFHGLHVLIGILFLGIMYLRMCFLFFIPTSMLGFEIAIYYWHFVDLVWLFLYLFMYWFPYL